MKIDISVIIPFLNESENINDLCNALEAYAKKQFFTLEAIFVDDGSTDHSVEMLFKYKFQNIKPKVVKLSRNYGSHAAIRAGVSKACGEYCMFFSADLQEPVELIGMFYSKIKEGYDAVYGRKRETNVSRSEGFFSRTYAKLIRKHAVPNFPNGGVNNIIFNQKIKNQLNTHVEQNSSIFLQIINMGFQYAIVDCDYTARAKGKSKWTFSKKIKMFIDSFVAFSYAPIRAVTVLGLIMAAIGIIWAIVIIVIKLFNMIPLSAGWPTTIAVLMVGFGITNISIGIIAEYLWRTLDVARGRPVYIIDEEIDLSTNLEDKGE